jgi:hypothetical protein
MACGTVDQRLCRILYTRRWAQTASMLASCLPSAINLAGLRHLGSCLGKRLIPTSAERDSLSVV